MDWMQAEILLLVAFEKAEVEGLCVSNAVYDCGRADLWRMRGLGGLLPGRSPDP